MKKTYNYNNTVYTSLTAIAKEIGKTRIYQKDFSKYGITVNEPSVATPEDVTTTYTTVAAVEAPTVEPVATTYTTVPVTYTTVDSVTESPTETVTTKPAKKTGTAEEIAEVEADVVDMTRFTFGKAITNFTIPALITMATNAGVTNLWEGISNQPIRKMRLIMELKEVYFPTGNAPKKTAAPTPWKGIPMDALVKLAKDNNIQWKEDKNEGINRMRLIMALKANKLQPSDLA